MFGTFQQSCLRIEVPASEQHVRDSLLRSDRLRQWLFPQRLSEGLPERLHAELTFTSSLGGIPVQHYVQRVEAAEVCFVLSQGIDGFHEWRWGEGWVQSRLEGISLFPLALGQTVALSQLRRFLIATNSESH